MEEENRHKEHWRVVSVFVCFKVNMCHGLMDRDSIKYNLHSFQREYIFFNPLFILTSFTANKTNQTRQLRVSVVCLVAGIALALRNPDLEPSDTSDMSQQMLCESDPN